METTTASFDREEAFVDALISHGPDAWRRLFDDNYRRVFGYAYVPYGRIDFH